MPTTSYSTADNGNDKCELRYFRTRWKGAKFDKYSDSLLKVSVSQPLLVISRLLWKKNQTIWSSWQSALPTTLACSACLGCSVLEEYGHYNWGKSTGSVLIMNQKNIFRATYKPVKRSWIKAWEVCWFCFFKVMVLKVLYLQFQQWIFFSFHSAHLVLVASVSFSNKQSQKVIKS